MKNKNQITHELNAARSWCFHVRSFVGRGLLRHQVLDFVDHDSSQGRIFRVIVKESTNAVSSTLKQSPANETLNWITHMN